MDNLEDLIEQDIGKEALQQDPTAIRPLALAYLGDTVFDLYIRQQLVEGTDLSTNQMHKRAVSYVNAASQARMMQLILDDLTEEETDIFKHARNHKSLTVPKNMKPVDYKWATGFEALLGWLYLKHRTARLHQLMHMAVQRLDAQKETAKGMQDHE